MRKLLWFTLGFAGAMILAAYIYFGSLVLLFAGICLCLCLGFLLLKKPIGRKAALFFLGCTVAFGWFQLFDLVKLTGIRKYDCSTVEAVITVEDYSYETPGGIGADGRITLDGKSHRIRFYLDSTEPLEPGDRVTGKFFLLYTPPRDSGAKTYHPGKGIFLLGYENEPATIEKGAVDTLSYIPARLRLWIKERITDIFPEDTYAFSRALLLGDSSFLSYDEDTDFKISGIRHIIAVSGLHISILFGAICLVAQNRKYLTAGIAVPVLLLFAAVAGFTPSIVRACVMQLVFVAALLLNKEYDPPTALSAAVLVILGANPMAATSASFQLSVGCMAGIFCFSGRISGWLLQPNRLGSGKGRGMIPRLKRWFAGSVSVTLSAMVFTVPLCACYFGMVSLVSVVTNLVTLWLVTFIFIGVLLALLASLVWFDLGIAIGWLISWPIRFVQQCAHWLSRVPLAAVYTCSIYIVVWLVLCYILFGYMLLSKKKKPIFVMGCMAVGLALALMASRLELKTEEGRLTALDVGQGQCLLIQTGNETYMIDCGGDYGEEAADTAAGMLHSYGVRRLDGLILTHFDRDHVGGAEYLLRRIPAETVYFPEFCEDESLKMSIMDLAKDSCISIENTEVISNEDYTFTLIPAIAPKTDNESSLCVLFQTENCDILITGDRDSVGEIQLLEQMQIPRLEILVAGHHGSEDATGLGLLRRTRPQNVVISVGRDNSYGHPDEKTLERLALFGCKVYRTDQRGTIILRW